MLCSADQKDWIDQGVDGVVGGWFSNRPGLSITVSEAGQSRTAGDARPMVWQACESGEGD